MPFAIKQPLEEKQNLNVQFAVLLRDSFADAEELLGELDVKVGTLRARRKESSGLFWFQNVTAGNHVLSVSSTEDPPYYLAKTFNVTIPPPAPSAPSPRNPWPAFPDIQLADPNLLLGDSGQTAAYKQQRTAATLFPTTAYPFPDGATLIRGTVTHAGSPFPGATVKLVGSGDPAYLTGADGQFVLYWQDAPGIPKSVTLNLTALGLPEKNQNVTVMRGLTASIAIDM
jgi:hypothetical protein